MAYTGQILDGYKENAIMKADDYNAAQTFLMGMAVTWDTANRRWILGVSDTVEEVGFCFDDTSPTMPGSDVRASGKLPVVVKNAWVASNQFDDGAGNLYTVLTGDVGSFVQCNNGGACVAGRWVITAPPVGGDTYVGIIRDVATINGIVMGIFDFEPRIFS